MSEDHKHRARIFLHRGDLLHARAAWEAAVADDRAAEDQRGLSDSLGNLGNTCALMRDFEHAEHCYREVLAIQRMEGNRHTIAHTLVNLGNLHIGTDHPAKARPYYLEALDLLHALNDHRALGILHNNFALQEAREGRWDQAVASFKRSLDYHRMVGNEEGLAVTYSQMGKGFMDQGDLTSAEHCLNTATEHYVKLGNEPAEAAVLRLLASLYQRRGDFVSSQRCLERVVLIDQRYNLSGEQDDSDRLAP
jgi:tetratricopeptide (TPR) repeat protein